MLKYLALISIIVLISFQRSDAQHIHFSQYYLQPLMINPALSGDYDGDMRLSTIQRRQWRQLGAPIVTNGFSAEKKIRIYPDFLTIGLQFVNDKISVYNLNTNMIFLSSSYMKKLGRHTVRLAVQGGFVKRDIDFSGLAFPSQYNSSTGYFDTQQFNGESNLYDNHSYIDFNVGVLWKKKFSRNYTSKTGISFSHLNKPNDLYSEVSSALPIRYVLHHTSEFTLNPGWYFLPKIQLMRTDGATNFLTLLHMKKDIQPEVSFYFGPGLRGYAAQNDAIIFTMGFELGYLDLGFAYDFNISGLSKASNRKSTIEFGAVLRTPPKKYKPIIHKKKLPCAVPMQR